eukprot:532987_1
MTSFPVILLLCQCFLHTINSQVQFISTQRNWDAANADCQSQQPRAHLLTATSTNSINKQACIDASTTNNVWIGLNKIQDGSTWEWISGVTYNSAEVSWANNNPQTGTAHGNCAAMKTSGFNQGSIRNRNTQCSDTKMYCCETDSTQPLPTVSPVSQPTTSTTTTTTTTESTTTAGSTTTNAPPTTTTTSTTSSTSTTSKTSTTSTGCGPRIRKEWNTASQEDRNVYINGLLELSERGILRKFTEQHGELSAESQAHGTSAFLPWHRLFLWELENAFRSLGGDYKCFSLFYWNWGLDASTYDQDYSKYSILNSGLGSSGDRRNNYCVTDGSFAVGSYTPYYCDLTSWRANDGTCCLRRRTAIRNRGNIDTIPEMTNAIYNDDFYGTDVDLATTDIEDGFRENVEYYSHGGAHCTMGTCGSSGGHLGNGRFSPDDPIFYLLHTYVDFIWAIWQDTNDYDLVDKSELHLNSDVYDGTEIYRSDVNDILIFNLIIAENYAWSTLTGNEMVRDVHNIEDLNVKYDKGSFFSDANIDDNNINSNWFVGGLELDSVRRMLDDTSNRIKFQQNAYGQLVQKFGKEYELTKEGKRKIVRAWAKMECEFKNSGDRECERPHYFDDCSDMELSENQYGKIDIVINLDELIGKVYDYPCMVETRERFYEWTKGFGLLKNLCRGEFDRFCGKQFLVGKKQYKCVERIDHENENLYYYIE